MITNNAPTVYLDHDRCAIICGMAVPTLRQLIPNKRARITVQDPPYGDHVHEHLGKERRNDGRGGREKLQFPPIGPAEIEEIAYENVRTTDGWIITFSDNYLSGVWGRAFEKAGGAWVRTGNWIKTNPMPQMTADRPACGHEDIVIAHSNPNSAAWEWNGKGHTATFRGPRPSEMEHPNQKPDWLLQAIIGMFAPVGAVLIDPFCGYLTAGVGALAKERIEKEIGIETACKNCAKRRAKEYQPPLPQGVSVIAIDADPVWCTKSAERILPYLRAL